MGIRPKQGGLRFVAKNLPNQKCQPLGNCVLKKYPSFSSQPNLGAQRMRPWMMVRYKYCLHPWLIMQGQ